MVKIAGIQNGGACWDTAKNVDKTAKQLREAAKNGAKILCPPEMFNTPYFGCEEDAKYFTLAETIPGPTTEAIGQVARETQTVIVATIFEKVIKGEYYDTAAVIGTDGSIIGKYRKMSLPQVRGKGRAKEKLYFKPGNLGFPVFDTPFGIRIGIQICYDRFFPEGARALGLAGADLVFVPTAAAGVTNQNVWESQMRVMARSNVYYVCGVNKVGVDLDATPDRFHFGESMIVNPKGEIISHASSDKEEIVYVEIDLAALEEERNSWFMYRDRRPDAYGSLVI